jgi:hypothetical protein
MEAIKNFMQDHYTDERLAELLAHAQDGKLAFMSCCCFIGIPIADHALQGDSAMDWCLIVLSVHYQRARALPGALDAEYEYRKLGELYT